MRHDQKQHDTTQLAPIRRFCYHAQAMVQSIGLHFSINPLGFIFVKVFADLYDPTQSVTTGHGRRLYTDDCETHASENH
jgi:hypothetical protein